MTDTFIAMCPHYWGKGETIDKAKRAMKAAGGSLTRYVVYAMPDGATECRVDDMGYLRWNYTIDAPNHGQPTVVASRGIKTNPTERINS